MRFYSLSATSGRSFDIIKAVAVISGSGYRGNHKGWMSQPMELNKEKTVPNT